MRCLIASDHRDQGQHCQEVLLRGGLECPSAHLVCLELAAERASRLAAQLVVLILGEDVERSLAAVREISTTIRTHLLVVGTADNPKLILRALHEGADAYLDEASIDQELAEAVIRAKGRRAAAQDEGGESGRVISLLAPSGGSGSSTLAVNLSTVLAREHGLCGLVDMRHSAGDLAPLLDLRPTYSVADVCENLGRIDRGMFERFFVRHASGVHLLAAPREAAQAAQVTAKGVRQILSMGRARFPYLVADLERSFSDDQVEVLWQSEVILLVLRLDYTSIRNARRTCEQLKELGVGLERVRLVANRYGERKQLSVAAAEEALGMKIASFIPNDPWRINRAINSGTPVVQQNPATRISRRIADLAASVNGCHRSNGSA